MKSLISGMSSMSFAHDFNDTRYFGVKLLYATQSCNDRLKVGTTLVATRTSSVDVHVLMSEHKHTKLNLAFRPNSLSRFTVIYFSIFLPKKKVFFSELLIVAGAPKCGGGGSWVATTPEFAVDKLGGLNHPPDFERIFL